MTTRPLAIYDHDPAAAILAMGYPDEDWTRASVTSFLGNTKRSNGAQALTLDDHATILGVILYSVGAKRTRIRRLAVRPTLWRRGFGRALLELSVGAEAPCQRLRLSCAVPETNLVGQLFLRGLGFICRSSDGAADVLSRRYGDVDGYLFRRDRRPADYQPVPRHNDLDWAVTVSAAPAARKRRSLKSP